MTPTIGNHHRAAARWLLPLLGLGLALALGSAAAPAVARSAEVKPPPQTISAGQYHSCALDSNGKAWCWGQGYGTGAWEVSPQENRAYTMLAAGNVTLGLDGAGQIWWWGNRFRTTKVPGDRAYTAITANDTHYCALDTAGKAWCFGLNDRGQFGDGSTSALVREKPVAVAGGRAYRAISAGGAHTCALDSAGKAWCWGSDEAGQVGEGAKSQADKYVPVKVAGNRTYTSIAAGGRHTCALDTAGKAWCWGSDASGQLGDGAKSQADKYAPVKAAGNRTYTSITGGGQHTCALDAAGKAWCWGHVESLGVWPYVRDASAPTEVPAPGFGQTGTYLLISAGGRHTCAANIEGVPLCWGSGEYRQNGTPGTTASPLGVWVYPGMKVLLPVLRVPTDPDQPAPSST